MSSTQVPPAEPDSVLTGYLLGQLDEDATEAFDQRSIADDEFAARLAGVEHELVDAYVRGELDQAVRATFESVYLGSPAGREKVAFARVLMREPVGASTASNRPHSYTAWLSAAAAAVLVAGLAWLTLSRSEEPAAGPPAAPPGQIVESAPVSAPPAPSRAVIALSLSPSAVRGGSDPAILTRPTEVATVSLTLLSDERPAALREPAVVIRTVSGREVWRGPASQDQTRADGVLARVDVDTSVLPPDDYIVSLRERSAAGEEQERARYFLRVRDR